MDLKKIIEKRGKLTEIEGDSIKYVEVVNITDINFRYGFSDKGWVVFYDDNKTLIKDDNYISLFKLLELPFERLNEEIRKNPLFENFKLDEFNVLFPLVNIVKTSINMESDYWALLSLEMLLHGKIYDDSLLSGLMTLQNQKWPSQKLKHKAKSYMSKVRDTHWSNSKIKEEFDD